MRFFPLSLPGPFPGLAWDLRGTVAVEYAVVIGTLAAAISLAFAGLGGRLVEKLSLLPI